jgi:hypothetical protein
MTERHDEGAIQEAIREEVRRADAFTNAATKLQDSAEERNVPEGYSDPWPDILEHVVPMLEVEARKGSEMVERLHQRRRQLRA